MKVISLNVNQFCGSSDWTKENRIEFRREKINSIIDYIIEFEIRENDIFICHEVPGLYKKQNKELYNEFITIIEKAGYKVITPNYWYENNRKPFITCAVVSKTSKWEVSDENFICSWFNSYKNKAGLTVYTYKYENRMIMLKNMGLNIKILGVHIPMVSSTPIGSVMWDDIQYMYKKDNNLLIMGDMNVYVDGTIQKRKYNELLSLGACDIWLEKGNKHNRITYKKGEVESRLDYAISSKEICSKVSIQILDEPRDKGISDHSALIIEFDKILLELVEKSV